MRILRSDDLVITPTGRRAMVRANDNGFVHLVYLDTREQGTCHERLLRKLRKGQEDPQPVRIDAAGRAR